MQALNKYRFRTMSMFVMSFINIILSIILAKKYGPVGCAIGTALSLIIVNVILMNIYYCKEINLNIKKFWFEIFKMTVPNIIPIIIILILMKLININGLLSILIFGSIYTIIYCITSYYLSMNNYERNIVNKVLIKFHLKKA